MYVLLLCMVVVGGGRCRAACCACRLARGLAAAHRSFSGMGINRARESGKLQPTYTVKISTLPRDHPPASRFLLPASCFLLSASCFLLPTTTTPTSCHRPLRVSSTQCVFSLPPLPLPTAFITLYRLRCLYHHCCHRTRLLLAKSFLPLP